MTERDNKGALLGTSPIRIAFTGKMGVGKTTAAKYIEDRYGVERRSLAAKVKAVESCIKLGGMERQIAVFQHATEVVPDYVEKAHNKRSVLATGWNEILKNEPDKRKRLQKIGTDIGRKQNENLWIDYLLNKLGDGGCVIDDVRFVGEAIALRNAGFTIVKLSCDQETRYQRIMERDGCSKEDVQKYGSHASEYEVEQIAADTWLNNDDIEDLYANLDVLVDHLTEGEVVFEEKQNDTEKQVEDWGKEDKDNDVDSTCECECECGDDADSSLYPLHPAPKVEDVRRVTSHLMLEMFMRHVVSHVNFQTIDNEDGTFTHVFEFDSGTYDKK